MILKHFEPFTLVSSTFCCVFQQKSQKSIFDLRFFGKIAFEILSSESILVMKNTLCGENWANKIILCDF